MKTALHTIIVSIAGAAALTGAAHAADADTSPQRPPPEAFTACQGKSTYEACSASFHGRPLNGTCSPADDNTLFCKPDRPPEGARMPPPEAFTACAGKSAAAGCSVALPDRTVDGTCAASPDGRLFCTPSRPLEPR